MKILKVLLSIVIACSVILRIYFYEVLLFYIFMASLVQVVFLIDVNYLLKYELKSELNVNNLQSKIYLCCLRLLTELGAQTYKDNVRWSFKFYNSSKFKPDISHKIFYDFNLSSLKKFESELQNICKKVQRDEQVKSRANDGKPFSFGQGDLKTENFGISDKERGETSVPQHSHSYILNKCFQEILFDYNWDRPDITSPVRGTKAFSSGKVSRYKNNSKVSDSETVTNDDLNFVIVFTHVPENVNEISNFIGKEACSSSDLVKYLFDSATLQGFIEEKRLRLHLINISKTRLEVSHKSSLQTALNKLFGGVHEIDNLVNDSGLKETSEILHNGSDKSIFLSLNEYKAIKGAELGLTSFYWWNKNKISVRTRVPQPGPSIIWEDVDGVSFLKIPLELLSVQGSSSKQWEDIYVKGIVRGNAMSLLGIGLPMSLLYVCHAPGTVFPTLLSALSEQNLFMILQLQNGGLVGLAPWVKGVGCLVLFSSTQLTTSLSKFKFVNTSNLLDSESSSEKALIHFVKQAVKKVLKTSPEFSEKPLSSLVQRFQPQMLQSWYPNNEISSENILSKPKKSKKDVSMLERLQKKYRPQMPRPLSGSHLPPQAMIDVTQPSAAAAVPDTSSVKSNISAALKISKFGVSRAQKLVKNSKIVSAQLKVKEQQAEEEKAACERKTLELQNRAKKKSFERFSKTLETINNPHDKDELAQILIKLRDDTAQTETSTNLSVEDLHSAAQSIVNLAIMHIRTYFSSNSVENELREILAKDVLLSAKQVGAVCKEKQQLRQFKLQVLLYLEVLWVLGYSRPCSTMTPDKRKSPRRKKDIGEQYIEEILKILRTTSLKYDPSTVGEFLRRFVVPNYEDSLGEILVEIFEELNQPLPSSLVPYANNEEELNTPAKPLSVKSQASHGKSDNDQGSVDLPLKSKEIARPQARRMLTREASNRQIIVPHVKRATRRGNTLKERKKEEGSLNKNVKSVRRNLFDKGERLKRSHTIASFESYNQMSPCKLSTRKRKRSGEHFSPTGIKKSPVTPAPKIDNWFVPETPFNAIKTTIFNKQRLLKSTGSATITESPDVKGEAAQSKNGFHRRSLPLSRRTSFYSDRNRSRNFEKGKLQLKLSHIKGPIEKRISSVSNASDSGDSSFIFSEILHKNSQMESESKDPKSGEKKKHFRSSLQLNFGLDEEEVTEPSPSRRELRSPQKRRYPESPLLKVRRSLSLVTPVKVNQCQNNSKCDNENFLDDESVSSSTNAKENISVKCKPSQKRANNETVEHITPKKLCVNNGFIESYQIEINRSSNHPSSFCVSKSPAQMRKKSQRSFIISNCTPNKVSYYMKQHCESSNAEYLNKTDIDSGVTKNCTVMLTPCKTFSPKLQSEKTYCTATNNGENIETSHPEEKTLEDNEPDRISHTGSQLNTSLKLSKSTGSEGDLPEESDFDFLGFSPEDANYNQSRTAFDLIKENLIGNHFTPSKRVQFNLNATPSKQDCNLTPKGSLTPKSILKTPQKSPTITPKFSLTPKGILKTPQKSPTITPKVSLTPKSILKTPQKSPSITPKFSLTPKSLLKTPQKSPTMTTKVSPTPKSILKTPQKSPTITPEFSLTSKSILKTPQKSPTITPKFSLTPKNNLKTPQKSSTITPEFSLTPKSILKTPQKSPTITSKVSLTPKNNLKTPQKSPTTTPKFSLTPKSILKTPQKSPTITPKFSLTPKSIHKTPQKSPTITPKFSLTPKSLLKTPQKSPSMTPKVSLTPESTLKTPQKSPTVTSLNKYSVSNIWNYTPKNKKNKNLKPSPFIRSPKFIIESFTPPLEKEMPSTIINEMFINSTPTHFEALIHSPITSVEKSKYFDKKDLKKNTMAKSHRKLQMPLMSPRKQFSPEKSISELLEVLNSPKKSLMNASTEFEIVSPMKKGLEAQIELVTYDIEDETTIDKVIQLSFDCDEEKQIKEPIIHQVDISGEVESESYCKNQDKLYTFEGFLVSNEGELVDSKVSSTLPSEPLDSGKLLSPANNSPNAVMPPTNNTSNAVMPMTNDDLNLVAELLKELDQVNSESLSEFPQNFESFSRNNSNRGSDSGISVTNPDQGDKNEKERSDDSIGESGDFKNGISDTLGTLESPCKIKSNKLPIQNNNNSNSELDTSPDSSTENLNSEIRSTEIDFNRDILKEAFENVYVNEIEEDSLVIPSSDVEEDLEYKEFPDIESKSIYDNILDNDIIYKKINQQEDQEMSPEIPLGIKLKSVKSCCEETSQNVSTKRKLFQKGNSDIDQSPDHFDSESEFDLFVKKRKYSETSFTQTENSLSSPVTVTDTLILPYNDESSPVKITSSVDDILSEHNSSDTSNDEFTLFGNNKTVLNSTVAQSNINQLVTSCALPFTSEKYLNISESNNYYFQEHSESGVKYFITNNGNDLPDEKRLKLDNTAQERDSNGYIETNPSTSSNNVGSIVDEPCCSKIDELDEKSYFSPLKCSGKNIEIKNVNLTCNSPSNVHILEPDSNVTPRRSNRKPKQTVFYESPVNIDQNYVLFSPVFGSRRKKSKPNRTSRKLYDTEHETIKDDFKESEQKDLQQCELSFRSISSPFEDNHLACNIPTTSVRLSDSFEIISPQKNIKLFEEEENAGIPEDQKTPIVIRIRKKKKSRRNKTSPSFRSERASKLKALNGIKSITDYDDESSLDE